MKPALYLAVVGIAAAGVGSAMGATQASNSQSDRAIVEQLRGIQKELRKANGSTGYLGKPNTVIDLLYGIQRNTQVLCDQVDNYRCVGP